MEHQPVQGPGGNERGTIVGYNAQSRYPAFVAGAARQAGFPADRKPDHQADGQRRGRRPPRIDGTARRCRGNRYLNLTAANLPAFSPDRTTARVRLRPTMTSDLSFVLSLEQAEENLAFITPWERM